jgi:hypothetical protein
MSGDAEGQQELDHMEDNEKPNGASLTSTLVAADDGESPFIWLVKNGRNQGAEDLRENHRVNSRFLRCLFSLPATGGNRART